MSKGQSTVKAPHGEKMIEVKLRFWTNALAGKEDHIIPKHAWSSGVARIERNESHGIIPQEPIPFNSLMEIPQVIEKILVDHEIILHVDRVMSKYLEK